METIKINKNDKAIDISYNLYKKQFCGSLNADFKAYFTFNGSTKKWVLKDDDMDDAIEFLKQYQNQVFQKQGVTKKMYEVEVTE
jgi:hypothetical protein